MTTRAGTAAVLTVFILELPQLDVVQVGQALEWVFYILLPNFSFNKALQDMYSNYQYGSICRSIDNQLAARNSSRTVFCEAVRAQNQTVICCPSKLIVYLTIIFLLRCHLQPI
jgi:ATP-binding cassette, subfamily A (ABC1), member 3